MTTSERNAIEYKRNVINQMMLIEQGQPESERYGAHLSHWDGRAKSINLDIGALNALLGYYNNLLEEVTP